MNTVQTSENILRPKHKHTAHIILIQKRQQENELSNERDKDRVKKEITNGISNRKE